MALLLKNKQRKTTSINTLFFRYLFQIIVFLMLITVFGIGFYMQINHRFEQSNHRILQNDIFFGTLSETQTYLYQRLFQICQQDTEKFKELAHYMEEFRQDKITTAYHRDIEDLSVLFSKYMESAEQLEQSVNQEKTYEESYLYYEQTNQIYTIMEGYHQSVREQIVSYEKDIVNFQKKMVSLYTFVFIICFLLICSTVVTETLKIRAGIIYPLHTLTETMRTVDLLNPTENIFVEEDSIYHDEVLEAIKAYNAMLRKLQKQNMEHEELMNTKLVLQKQMYLNLQHQINPHFLFNTLNMISQTAYLEGNDQTVRLIETTADLLRYSLDYSDHAVTLLRELEALEHYVSLQEERFGKRIQFIFDLDENFGHVKIPSLILQPLVENAITHGVAAYESGGEIRIQTKKDAKSERVRVSIIDNGLGMEKHQLEQVKADMEKQTLETEKIGLSNVFIRLDIFYDHRADIEIVSIPNIRTEFALLLPYD